MGQMKKVVISIGSNKLERANGKGRWPLWRAGDSSSPGNAQEMFIASDGSIEALKWLGLLLMTVDHVNKYLFHYQLPAAFELGRIAMPLFGFVLAYNLTRPLAVPPGRDLRAMKRMALSGVIASPFFISLGHVLSNWWPLNVMFMLLGATVIIHLLQRPGFLPFAGAALIFLVGGALVEFWWFGLLYCIAAWCYLRSPKGASLGAWIAATGMLYFVNRNHWALAAIPLIFAASWIHLEIPRNRWLFYCYYPAHLAVLLSLQWLFDLSR